MDAINLTTEVVLLNVLRSAHGRRMFCAVRYLGMKNIVDGDSLPNFQQFLRVFSRLRGEEQEDIKRMFRGPADAEVGHTELKTILRRGLIPDKSISPTSPLFGFFRESLRTDKFDSPSLISLIELASPALSPHAVETLFNDPDANDVAKIALGCNVNFPKKNPDIRPPVPLEHVGLLPRIYSVYGDIGDPAICASLMREAPMSDHLVTEALSDRHDLPKELAKEMLTRGVDWPAGFGTSGDYPFGRTLGGQAAIDERMTGEFHVEDYLCQNRLKLSPSLNAQVIHNLHGWMQTDAGKNTVASWYETNAALVTLPNAPTPLLIDVASWKAGEPYMEKVLEYSEIPQADEILCDLINNGEALTGTLGTLPFVRAESLDAALPKTTGGDVLKIVSHPNFPWNKHSPETVMWKVEPGKEATLYCTAFLSGKANLAEMDDIVLKQPVAALFSPSLSAKKLSDIAERFPELAPLAKCHPNGHELQVGGTVGRRASAFLRMVPSPLLCGKGDGAQRGGEQLVL